LAQGVRKALAPTVPLIKLVTSGAPELFVFRLAGGVVGFEVFFFVLLSGVCYQFA